MPRPRDPRAILEVLWRHSVTPAVRPGPAPKLSVDELVEAAVALADAEGLGAVTVRRLAQDLGVATMSIYTYVSGKPELVELMLDWVYSAIPANPSTACPGGVGLWRSRRPTGRFMRSTSG